MDGAEVPAVQLAREENENGAKFQIQTPPLARLYTAEHKIRVFLENSDAGCQDQ